MAGQTILILEKYKLVHSKQEHHWGGGGGGARRAKFPKIIKVTFSVIFNEAEIHALIGLLS